MDFIFSFTSYPKRFPFLDVVVRSLQDQSIPADQIILNIAKEDKNQLSLKNTKNVEINFVEDLKAMKKLLPTLEKYPECNIITIDDDTIYPKDLAEKLLVGASKNPGDVIAGRARKIVKNNNKYLPYLDWEVLFDGHSRAKDIVPNGVGGVLYPSESFHKDVFDRKTYLNYLNKDDFWWYTQARRAGKQFVQIPIFDKNNFPNIDHIANKGLFYYGNKYENDKAFAKLRSKYGDFVYL